MTDTEFWPYHNRHIRFGLKSGQELSGVLVDSFKHREPGLDKNIYTFIPTRNMIVFKQAEQNGDEETMKKLKGEVDLNEVAWAELIVY